MAILVPSFGLQPSRDTLADNTSAKTQMDLVVSGTFGGPVTCDSSIEANCFLATGSAFTVSIVPRTIPVGGYAGWQTLLDYGSLLYKPGAVQGENEWDASGGPARVPQSPTGKEGQVGHADMSAQSSPFPVSTQKSALVTLNFNCARNAGGGFFQTVQLVDLAAATSGAAFIEPDGVTTNVPNTSPLYIWCRTVPAIIKGPALSNLFLTAQGEKVPPDTCLGGADASLLSVDISTQVGFLGGFDKDGRGRRLGGFSFKVTYDETKVCVVLTPGTVPIVGGWDCIIYDSLTKPSLQGSATIACNQFGKAPISLIGAFRPRHLATILVQPMPEEYSMMRPNNGNGNVVQIISSACKMTDTQGDAIAPDAGTPHCTDVDITIRYLEGDVVPDCEVNTLDTQAVAFRWGSQKGSLLYSGFFNTEPSKPQQDDDIDINDLQFVYGRFGSTCENPHPDQAPVNPKAA